MRMRDENARQKLEESEKKLNLILDNANDSIVMVSKDLKILYMNEKAKELFGDYQVDKMCYNILMNREEICEECTFNKLFTNYQPDVRFETYFRKPLTNEDIYLEFNCTPIFNFNGKPAIIDIIRDITDRKQFEEALIEGERFLSNVFNSIQDGICVIDRDFNIIRANPTMKKWYLYMKTIIGKKCYQVYRHRTEICENCECYKLIKSNNEIFDGSIFSKAIDKVIGKIYDVYSFPFIDQETGELKGFIKYLRDVTERDIAEAGLKESEDKYRSILENIKEGYFESDLKGNHTFFNNAFCNLLGYTNEELMGINFTQFMDEFNKKKAFKYFNQVYNSEIPQTGLELEIIKKNREKIYIETSAYLRYDKDGNKIGFCGVVRDITEKKKAEKMIELEIEKLKELDQIKSEFVYRSSHELKTPLNSICGASSLLLDLYKDKLDYKVKELLDIINKGGGRLEGLIEDLLDVSRFESGKMELIKNKENIGDIIKECVNDVKHLVQKRELYLKLDIYEDFYIKIDKIRFEQVIMNILTNAIKNTPPKGIISISLERQNNFIDIKIKDTGVGFTADEIKKIFKKFGKIERYGKGMDIDTEGSGLGLFISKEIIDAHKGRIWVESEGRNKGSTFIIRLPKN